ncbi:MAG: DUF2283 domain-containing protein [Candidatus Levyibacteriota bacterium]
MKFEYDKEADAAYICMEDSIANGQVQKTIELDDNIIVDFDKNGKLLGIEILSASKVLHQKSLLEAQFI